MSSAKSITASVHPPRAVYVDYPLGHTSGKPLDEEDQNTIMRATLDAFHNIQVPGEIVDLGREWLPDDAWKDRVMRPRSASKKKSDKHEDDRIERFDTPQYQSQADHDLADSHCSSCVFLADTR